MSWSWVMNLNDFLHREVLDCKSFLSIRRVQIEDSTTHSESGVSFANAT